MPVFLIKREVPGVTQEDVDAAAYRAIACAYHFPGMRWHRSYWDAEAGLLYCVYEAADTQELFAHAERARIPCNEVREVSTVTPEAYTGESPHLVNA